MFKHIKIDDADDWYLPPHNMSISECKKDDDTFLAEFSDDNFAKVHTSPSASNNVKLDITEETNKYINKVCEANMDISKYSIQDLLYDSDDD